MATLPLGMDMRKLSALAYRLHRQVQWPGLVLSMEQCRDLIAALPNLPDWATVVAERDAIANRWLDLAAFQRLSERIGERFDITLDPAALIALLTTNMDIVKKIRKRGPFRIARLSDEYSQIAHLMNVAVKRVEELPDFSGDKGILVASDFGGEHKEARFRTYSFIFVSWDKNVIFTKEVEDVRKKHGIFDAYSEFKFKDLAYGPRRRALLEFLGLVDKYIHGAVITISVQKEIDTLFGTDRHQTYNYLVSTLAEKGFGEWNGPSAEKVCRVCHFLAMLSSLLLSDGHKLVWYCDNDDINQDGNKRSFQNTCNLFENVLGMYLTQRLESLGFGKSFPDKGFMDDLLSVADFAAGVVQLRLQAHANGDDPGISDEKAALLRWIATPTAFLSKINIQIVRMDDGQLGAGLVDFTLN